MTTSFFAALLAVTAGWENVCAGRREPEPAKALWRADFARPAGFRLDRVGGAEGVAVFTNGTVRVRKTNSVGMLVLRAPSFPCGRGARLRLAADVSVLSGNPESAHLCVRGRNARGAYPPCHGLYPARGAEELYSGGPELMLSAVNSAPGMSCRKYGHMVAERDAAELAVIASGTPSEFVLKGWFAEDVDAAQEKWRETFRELTARDRAADRMPEPAFDSRIAADVDHTACVRSVDGVTRLFVDGEMVPPAAFRAKGSFGPDALLETFSGASVARAGVRLLAKPINMGTGAAGRHYWSRDGFDAKGAVADLKGSMRLAPDALFLIALNCNPYPDFTRVEHPDEAFVRADGRKLMGNGGSTSADFDDMGIKDSGERWPWVSFASRVWRDAVNANIRALVAELKAQGLSRRVVGIHLCGFGDGQFYVGPHDCSPAAKRGYAQWAAEGGHVSTNYAFYAKCLAMSAQDEFARTFKTAMGKDSVAVIWLTAQFITTHYLGEFQRCRWVAAAVIQQSYPRRHPGLWVEPRMPYSSFERHGKMYWCELDLRTYGALDSWAVSAPATKGLGQADDIEAWRTTYRKHLGPVIAQRQGFWFYDMAAGWFDPPEIRDDIAETLDVLRRLQARKPSAWRPSVAVVFDEAGLIGWDGGTVPLNDLTHLLTPVQMERLAQSGVPFEFFLAEDALADPDLLRQAKTVVLANFRRFDAARVAFVKRLAKERRTVVFTGEAGVLGGGAEAMGLAVGYSRAETEPHVVRAEPGVRYDLSARMTLEAERDLADGVWPVKPPCGPRAWIEAGDGVTVLARYADGRLAVAERAQGAARFVCVAEPSGLSPAFFNDLCRESGAYVPTEANALQVSMNGDFISVHALRNGRFDFRLPFPAVVTNVKSGEAEATEGDRLRLDMTAGETCWFELAAAASGAEDGEVVIRADEGDVTSAVRAGIDRLRARGGGTLRFERGEYHLDAAKAAEVPLYISNHDKIAVHPVFLPLTNLVGVTVDGGGSSLVFHGKGIAALVMDSERVTLKNLTIDWKRPYNTEFTVLGHEGGGALVEADPARYPVEIRGGRLYAVGEGWAVPTGDGNVFSKETLALPDRHTYAEFSGEAEARGGNRYWLKADLSRIGLQGARPGDVFVSRPNREPWRPHPAIAAYRAKDTTVEDVVLHAAFGMGILAQRCENFTMRGTGTGGRKTCGVWPAEGRMCAQMVDATHFVGVKGKVSVTGCRFERMLDDAINVHSTGLGIVSNPAPDRIVCRGMHAQGWGFEMFRAGERLRFIKVRTLENREEAVVTAVRALSPREMELTLAAPVPAGIGVGDAVENADWQCAVDFRDNVVARNLARGVLFTTPKPVRVEGNLFENVSGAAILLAGDARLWHETGGCDGVRVSGNVFRDCLTSHFQYCEAVISAYPTVEDLAGQTRAYHRNLTVVGNTFETFGAPLLFARSVAGIDWRENRIVTNDRHAKWHKPLFTIDGCSGVTIDPFLP